ncbi:MAG: flavodoxin [Candidatus Vecturithrix sp.]|jgi:flavodoxin|nr:flavodoxin [Candidatus Vecturithrix sp.]
MANQIKKLVVYYSLGGNTTFIAKIIAETIQADILVLQPKKAMPSAKILKFLWAGKQALAKEKPELLPFEKDPTSYDLIFLGTPVWAGSYAAALRTFFATVTLQHKNIALFCCYGGSEGKAIHDMKEALAGNIFSGEMGFRAPLKNAEVNAQKAREWAKMVQEK